MTFGAQPVRTAVFAVSRRTAGAPPISWFRGLTSNTYAYWKFVGFTAVPGYAARPPPFAGRAGATTFTMYVPNTEDRPAAVKEMRGQPSTKIVRFPWFSL